MFTVHSSFNQRLRRTNNFIYAQERTLQIRITNLAQNRQFNTFCLQQRRK